MEQSWAALRDSPMVEHSAQQLAASSVMNLAGRWAWLTAALKAAQLASSRVAQTVDCLEEKWDVTRAVCWAVHWAGSSDEHWAALSDEQTAGSRVARRAN